MKKVANIISIIYILTLIYITREEEIFNLTFSFSLFLLYRGLFSMVSIKDNNYSKFKLSVLSIIVIFIPLTLISYLIAIIMNIKGLNIINVIMTITCMLHIIINVLKDYLSIVGYKKTSNNIINICYSISNIISLVISILLFKIFDIKNNNIIIIILYSIRILSSIIIFILCSRYLLKTKKTNSKFNIKTISEILFSDKIKIIYNIINYSYFYVGMIILYYILTNKYYYSFNNVSLYITNTLFYGFIITYFIFIIMKKYLNINIEEDFIKNMRKIIKFILPCTIFLCIISKSLSNILFGINYNVIAMFIPILFIFIIYDFIFMTNNKYNSNKKNIISMIIGFILTIIFEIPLINSISRMGHEFSFGCIISITIGILVSTILGIIFICNKLKINLLNNFNELLNIIYDNIIYTLVLVLFTFIIKINTTSIINSILVILFYLFITILFYIVKRRIGRK